MGVGFGMLVLRNTFTVENTAAAPYQPVVYLSSEDVNRDPQELVAPDALFVKVLPNEVGYLNVRKGPGTGNAKITQVKPGDELEYTEIESNWYHIVLEDDATGWVSGDYVEEVEG